VAPLVSRNIFLGERKIPNKEIGSEPHTLDDEGNDTHIRNAKLNICLNFSFGKKDLVTKS
jgi:hypothetical protein